MNDKLKELSDIAYRNHLKNNPHSSFGRRSDYDKELAELIIRECIAWVEDNNGHDGPSISEMKEHFGIE